MHDGAPEHFSIAVCNHLQVKYPRRWIEHDGPVAWPPRSMDLNPLYLFIWGHLKSLAYETPVAIVKDLMVRNVITSADITRTPDLFKRSRQSFIRWCRLCN
ncbi:uncharacterized protein TNCV_2585561 [Trichonephila clavipes]|nr:uncharacterized protein TNCV_2585561 [Trichonephila clavipes]